MAFDREVPVLAAMRWRPRALYADLCTMTVGDEPKIMLQAEKRGISGLKEPLWELLKVGDSVVDGAVIWTRVA